jgi:hypothetical protein
MKRREFITLLGGDGHGRTRNSSRGCMMPLASSSSTSAAADVLDGTSNELRRIVARRALHHDRDQLRVLHRVSRTEHAVDLLAGKLQSRDRIAHARPPSPVRAAPATTLHTPGPAARAGHGGRRSIVLSLHL